MKSVEQVIDLPDGLNRFDHFRLDPDGIPCHSVRIRFGDGLRAKTPVPAASDGGFES